MTRVGGRASITLALVGILLVVQVGTADAASPRPGRPCAKAGATVTVKGVSLRCTKVKAKRVWVRVPAARPTTSATPASGVDPALDAVLTAPLPRLDPPGTFQPISVTNGPAAIESLLSPVLRLVKTPPANVVVNVDPAVRTEWARDQVEGVGTTYALLGAMGVGPSDRATISIGRSFGFLAPSLRAGWCSAITGDSDPMLVGGNCGDGNIWTNTGYWESQIGGQTYPYPDRSFDLWLNGNLPHEIAHSAQHELIQKAYVAGRPDAWRTLAAWVREGFPELTKVAVWGATRGLTYRQAREEYFVRAGQRCAQHELAQLLSEQTTADRCEYDYGLLATEYLVASFRALQAPLWMLQRATSSTFEAAFAEAYGVQFADFAREADAYVRAHYAMHA